VAFLPPSCTIGPELLSGFSQSPATKGSGFWSLGLGALHAVHAFSMSRFAAAACQIGRLCGSTHPLSGPVALCTIVSTGRNAKGGVFCRVAGELVNCRRLPE